jgi:hypothetical protein
LSRFAVNAGAVATRIAKRRPKKMALLDVKVDDVVCEPTPYKRVSEIESPDLDVPTVIPEQADHEPAGNEYDS